MGAANIRNASDNLTFTINNRHYRYSIARNGVLTTRSDFVNEVNFIGKIEQNYQQVLAEKQERIRQEKIRQEKLRREKEALEKKLAQQSADISKQQQSADAEMQNKLTKLNEELDITKQSIANAESFLARVEQSRQEFVTTTVAEIVTEAKTMAGQ